MPTTTPSRVADQDSFELAQTQGRTNGAGSEKSPVSGFSLNDLMQCENFDSVRRSLCTYKQQDKTRHHEPSLTVYQVENNLQELHSFTYQFPETSGSLNSHVTNVELDIMVNLCGDIDSCLKRIRRLRNQEPESPVNASRSSDSRVSSNSYRRKKVCP